MKWAPGQHVFVRVLGLGVHALTSHPFTISSLHTSSGGEGKEEAELELVMRVHGGLTHALARRVAGKAAWATRVVVDGPYGGLHVPLQAYERVYLLAGGSGAFICFFPFIHSFFLIFLNRAHNNYTRRDFHAAHLRQPRRDAQGRRRSVPAH